MNTSTGAGVAARGSFVALAAILVMAGCTSPGPPTANAGIVAPSAPKARPKGDPGSYSIDPGAKPTDPFGYDGRKWRRGLGG